MARGPKRAPVVVRFLIYLYVYILVCIYMLNGEGLTRSVTNSGIKRSTDHGDIIPFIRLNETFDRF